MPHLTIEYTDNLPGFNSGQALLELNQALLASGQFEEADIKSRAIRLDQFLVGCAPTDQAFVHASLAILSGRPAEIKRQLADSLLQVLQKMRFGPENSDVQLCVEIIDIDRGSYAKARSGVLALS